MRVKFIWPYDVTFVTGPVSGPVQPGDERDVTDEEGAAMLESGFWVTADQPVEVTEPVAVAVAEDVEQPVKGKKKEAIAKPEVTKEVQSQDQQ